MSTLLHSRPLSTIAVVLLGALVPACYHGSSSSAGSGSGGNTPLTISNLVVEPGPNFALVRWTTNLASDSRVDFGLSSAYTNGVADSAALTQHALLLTGLLPGNEYHFNARSATVSGLTAQTGDGTFQTGAPGAILSDDFNRFNLNRTLWTYSDPHSRGELMMKGAGTNDARVVLRVPENTAYRPENGTLRLVQEARDISPAEFEAKFVNRFNVVDGNGGVFVENGPGTFTQFGFRFDGTNLVLEGSEYSSGGLVGTQSSFVQAGAWNDTNPLYLRVRREGNQYQSKYSFDGQNWVNGPAAHMNGAPTVAGLFVANGPGSTAPMALTTDYLFDLANPLPAEDLGTPDDHDAPYIYRYEALALSDAAGRLRWWSDEPSSGELRYGLTPAVLGGVEYKLQPDWVNELLISGLDPASLYYLQLAAPDGRGQTATLSGLTITTPDLTGGNPAARVWNGWDHPTLHLNYQSFGINGNPQDRVNIVGRIYDTDEDRVDLNDTLTWTLNGGPTNTALLGDPRWITGQGEAPWRLTDEGDFNIELPVSALGNAPLVDGSHKNELRMIITDNDGHVGIQTVFVLWKPNTSWPRNYTTNFAQAALNNKQGHQYQVQVVDGDWYIDNTANLGYTLRTNPKRLGYDRLFAIGEALSSTPWDNYEALIPFTVMGFDLNGFTQGTGSYAFGVVNRWNGHQPGGNFSTPPHGVYPLSSLFAYRWFDLSGNESWQMWENQNGAITNFSALAIVPGDVYWMKVRVQTQTNGSTLHRMKVWRQSDAEPSTWAHEQSTPQGEGPSTGSLAIFAHHVDLMVGDIAVTGL